MLDKRIFAEHMAVLAERFDRKLSQPLTNSYYTALSNTLTTEQFIQAARLVLYEGNFWPSPAEFVDKVKGRIDEAAQLEWSEVMSAVTENRPRRLTESGKAALSAVGGAFMVQNSTNPSGLRRDFIAAYVAAERRDRIEQATTALPDHRVKELAENIIQGRPR